VGSVLITALELLGLHHHGLQAIQGGLQSWLSSPRISCAGSWIEFGVHRHSSPENLTPGQSETRMFLASTEVLAFPPQPPCSLHCVPPVVGGGGAGTKAGTSLWGSSWGLPGADSRLLPSFLCLWGQGLHPRALRTVPKMDLWDFSGH